MKKFLFLFMVLVLNETIVNAQWQLTTAPQNPYYFYNNIATDGTNIFYGVAGQGVYISNDNGLNWTLTNNGLTNTAIYSITINGANIFVGTSAGVFFSNNNGGLWTPVNNGLTGTLHINSLASSGANVYAVKTYNGLSEVYLTTNNGGLWTSISNGLPNYVYCITSDGINVFAGTGSGMFLSTDNGNTWISVSNGMQVNTNVKSIAISGTNIYAGTNNGMFFSSDNGNNWIALNNGLTDINIYSLSVNGNDIFTGTGHGVYINFNNGVQWNNITNGLPDTTTFALAINGTYIFATDSIGLWRRPLSDIPPSSLTLSLSSTSVTCNGSCNGIATASASGGTPPYTYAWSNGDTAQTFTNLCPGNYGVTVYDAASNAASASVTVNQPTVLTVSIAGTQNPTTNGGSDGFITIVVAGGTPGYTYLWSNSQTTQTATNLSAGIYTVTVSDAHGCSSIATAQLFDTSSTCQAGFTYQYDTMYGVTTFNGFNNVNDSNAFPISYLWMFGDGTSDTGHFITHQYSHNGVYNVCLTIQTANGCSSTFCDSVLLGNYNPCNADFSYLLDSVNTSGSTFSFTSTSTPDSGATIVSYNWNFGDSINPSSTLQNPTHTYTLVGTYIVTLHITTSSGCSSIINYHVNVNGNQNTTCHASFYSYPDSINVPPMQQYNFVDQSVPDSTNTIVSWSWTFFGGTPATSTAQNPMGIVFPTPGTYTICLTIATSSGCSTNYCETITVGNNGCQLYANITTQSPSIIGGSDGYIETTVSGGTPGYTYLWSTSATTSNIYNLTSGYYTLSVTDANGCQNIFYAELYEPYDTTGGNIVDTLYTGILDSCLNFVPDSFYIASITTDPNSFTTSVVWVFVGGGQTATFTVTYTFSQYGNTLVIITLNCGTKTLTTYQSYINITNTSSVPIYGIDQNLFVYPVPFGDKLNIDFTTQKSENVNILLIDASGRILVTKKINSNSGVNNTELNTSQLSSGVYILNIETSNGVIRKQIVK